MDTENGNVEQGTEVTKPAIPATTVPEVQNAMVPVVEAKPEESAPTIEMSALEIQPTKKKRVSRPRSKRGLKSKCQIRREEEVKERKAKEKNKNPLSLTFFVTVGHQIRDTKLICVGTEKEEKIIKKKENSFKEKICKSNLAQQAIVRATFKMTLDGAGIKERKPAGTLTYTAVLGEENEYNKKGRITLTKWVFSKIGTKEEYENIAEVMGKECDDIFVCAFKGNFIKNVLASSHFCNVPLTEAEINKMNELR